MHIETENEPANLRNFIIIWIGQMVSAMGSSMTSFAVSIWVWELTDQATSLTMLSFFSMLPSIAIALVSGIIVDRYNRKLLMILGDTVSVATTIIIVLLYLTNNLEIWHLYITGAVSRTFTELQSLAYAASLGLMVPKKHYSRASSLEFFSHYGSQILAPAFAGYLYHIIGLVGISIIDMLTFTFAISSVLLVKIPQPVPTELENQHSKNIWRELIIGWRYIYTHKSLLALLITGVVFWFFHDLGGSLYTPMILSRSQNDTVLLGSLSSAAGLGGVIGALVMSTWGGPKRHIQGFLWGIVGAGISKTFFGIANMNWMWIGAQFCSSLNFPLNGSSENAIWIAKVPANLQGRVFAARSLLLQLFSAIAYLIAGPLADQFFEPAMKPNGQLAWLFGGIFGIDKGAGMALLYVMSALCMLLVGVFGFYIPLLGNIKENS
ncbi:MFS transporter [Nostoc sp. FACHB-145]|uniref:MFS transporter n=1 Tax=Nostoc sp. FACHB-145 TaxID=2692836 RepID=UPI001684D37A|nr:MFS transporter [Nostoc sp. FACHB-145]MBD2468784.1 MFS transporter [Nostoc sp. FACHB-145]